MLVYKRIISIRMLHIAVIFNPISGAKGRKEAKRTLFNLLRNGVNRKLYDVTFYRTRHSKQATELTQKAIENGSNLIICCGGDGTVNETALALLGKNTPLAIIPAGSGNGLARHLGIPLSPKNALNAALEGPTLRMDCGSIAGKLFCTTAGIGLDAEVGWLFANLENRGMAAYLHATAQLYFKYKPRWYTIKINGQSLREQALLITFANASQFGNNAVIAPKANVTDGYLDLVIVRPFPKVEIAVLAAMLFNGNIDKSQYVKTIQFKQLHIVADEPTRGHADGEPIELPQAFDVHVHPACLSVRTPILPNASFLNTQGIMNTLRNQTHNTYNAISKNVTKQLETFEKGKSKLQKTLKDGANELLKKRW